ncbi:MAG: hypothetical protein PHT81_05720 [Endomicrobiaceae bacterium]|nr:hypothetical protein [Endomicrobiaceae bacterium]
MHQKKASEIKIVEAVERFILKKWEVVSKREIPFCERSLDVFLKKRDGSYVAIEAKVDATSKAFKQADRYKYIADYVYVAILENRSNTLANMLSKETGIGLILVKRDSLNRYYVRLVKKAKKLNFINAYIAKEIYNNYFLKRGTNE